MNHCYEVFFSRKATAVFFVNAIGMYGQLGHGNTEKQSAPKLVTGLEGQIVYLLACGNFHTVS